MFDILIIGSGPAGMTAAIYGARINLKVGIVEKNAPGGAMVNTYKIENYPGFDSIAGADLSLSMFSQMANLGVEFISEEAIKVEKVGDHFRVITLNNIYNSKTLIIATGTLNNKLNVLNENKFSGRGISWCAVCDGSFYKGKDVIVVGGGNSALEESLYLANIVNHVYIVHRRNEFRADPIVVKEVKEKANISFIFDSVIKEFSGDKVLNKVLLENVKTREEVWLEVSGCFEYVGHTPASAFLNEFNIVNSKGYIDVDRNYETKIKGMFAAGDIIEKDVRQIATAVNDGAIAALSASRYCK